MEWFNIDQHADMASWKPFFISNALLFTSWGLELITIANIATSVAIRLGQLAMVGLGVYIAAHNAYGIYKKNKEDKIERERTSK
jgi:hypothetical protein